MDRRCGAAEDSEELEPTKEDASVVLHYAKGEAKVTLRCVG